MTRMEELIKQLAERPLDNEFISRLCNILLELDSRLEVLEAPGPLLDKRVLTMEEIESLISGIRQSKNQLPPVENS